ncbi:MAG: phage head closure protein [Ruminococcus flavefaciens]|nr:phage head closure protein [Ruminococcus flavefaciens]MCM1062791.1 phage head closure protein [Eubacterium sp.]
MEIGKLNQRITILEQSTRVDHIGNHKAQWDELFSCWASVSVKNSVENSDNGTTKEVQTLQFMIRQNSMTMGIGAAANRISFRGAIYDIVGISPNFEHRDYLKITAKARKAGAPDDIY